MRTATSGLCLGVDVGGTKILAIACDQSGSEIASSQVPSPQGVIPDGGVALADAVARVIDDVATQLGIGPAMLPMGVGLPGMLTLDGVLAFAPNLRSSSGANLARLLAERLGSVTIVVANDADCAAVAEQRLGAARGHDDVIMVTLGTGIGGGIILGGQLLRGGHGFAGEIGHMVVDIDGPPCPCGARGCWERYASGSAVGRLAREAAHAGRLAGLVAAAGGDAEAVRGEDVTAAALEGDSEALALMDEVAWWLARGIANLACVLDPSCVVLGGGLSEVTPLLIDSARQVLPNLLEGGADRPPIVLVPAALGSRAGALGASLMARSAA